MDRVPVTRFKELAAAYEVEVLEEGDNRQLTVQEWLNGFTEFLEWEGEI